MSTFPRLDFGFWNAWLLVFPWLIVNYVPAFLIINRRSSIYTWPIYSRGQRLAVLVWTTIIACLATYSLILPLALGTIWFYVGVTVCIVGLVIQISAYAVSARTPPDQVVTEGVYRYSRNPMGLSLLLAPVGIGIAALSWIFVFGGVAIVLLINYTLSAEEATCHERFGDAYQDYVNRTPKWIGIPKLD